MAGSITPTPFQAEILRIPEEYSLFLGGGRGGGKSYSLNFLILRHEKRYGRDSKILYLRKSFPAIREFEQTTKTIFSSLYGSRARYNSQSHIWRLPHGGTFELGQLDKLKDYDKYQGRSFNLIIVDEGGQFPSPDLLDLIFSNLRGPKHIPTRIIVAANPGGVGHYWLARRFALRPEGAWNPFYDEDSEAKWVYVPSTFRDNPTLDQADYEQRLRSSSAHDLELQKAWLTGDWTISRGAFFSDVISGVRQTTYTPKELIALVRSSGNPRFVGQQLYLAHDWGSSAPSATYLLFRSPGIRDNQGRFWPPGTVIALDEYATYKPARLHQGTGETPVQLAAGIKEMCARWRVSPIGVADDACFAKARGFDNPSIADEFADEGVRFEAARKGDRITGWTHMRTMMQNAGSLEKPSLIVDPRCFYFWQTVPTLTRHERKPEDIGDNQPDHGADAVRYGLNWQGAQYATGGAVQGAS